MTFYYIFDGLNLPELVFLSSPYFVILLFLSIFFLFKNISNKYLAVLVSFLTLFSSVIFFRTSVLFLDTDVLNLTFFFLILFLISLLLDKEIHLKNYYIILISIILLNQVFAFHYPRPIFSIIFFIMTTFSLFLTKIGNKQKLIFLSLFFFTILARYGFSFYQETIDLLLTYQGGQIISETTGNSLSSSVSELKLYSIFEIEKFIFYRNYYGVAIIFSLVGLFIFLLQKKSEVILFLPFIVFTYLTFNIGIRFIVYVIPFFYFGFLYTFYYSYYLLKQKIGFNSEILEIIFSILIIFYIWNNYYLLKGLFNKNVEINYSYKPYFNKEIVKGIVKTNNISNNYNLYTAWDYGYLISYYSKSKNHLKPGGAFNNNKFKVFFSDQKINNTLINQQLSTEEKDENYFFVTKDFVKWWPTINDIYKSKEDVDSNIIAFNCNIKKNSVLKCISQEGIQSTIDIEKGEIDGSKILHKSITNIENKSTARILNEDGSVMIVYSPELKKDNIYAIFPKSHNNKNFIKYFFDAKNDKNLKLVDSNWPYYRTYRVLN